MRRMLIIADDLSGAADCACSGLSSGLSVAVTFGDMRDEIETEVLSVDADTRNLESGDAAEQTKQILRRHGSGEGLLLFKKLDSTLRGNFGAELAAMLEVRRELNLKNGAKDRVVAVMAPAFPAGGRTTVAGHQLLHGKPLHESATWPQGSVCPSDIPLVIQTTGMRPRTIGLELVRSSDGGLHRAMKEFAVNADVLVCDAETDDDLRAIANASFFLGRETVWAGSAGLAAHLPCAAGLSGRGSRPSLALAPLATGPTLMVIGSMSSVSQQQARVLASSPDVRVLRLAAEALLEGPGASHWSSYADSLETMLRGGDDVLVTIDLDDALDSTKGELLRNALGALAAPLAGSVGALVASGGETARSVLQAWGVTVLRVIGELEPGIPFSVTENWSRPLPVLTKAGAFGNPKSLLHCWSFLRELDRNAPLAHSELRGS